MRAIRFRAWDKVNKTWIYSNHQEGLTWFFGLTEKYDCELMQFTGCKDTKDKDIYEGDIVKYKDICSDECMLNNKEIIGVINWIDNRCSLNPQQIQENTKGGHYIALWDNITKINVIGNIYENSELMK